jgi:hypothetical protein
MSPKRAPIVAAWMLEHLVPGDRDEAFEGDLLEELCSGRSSAWYRRQVSGSIAAAWLREISDHRSAFGFATVWSMLAPAWIALDHTKAFVDVTATARRLDWPWSALCPVALWLSLLMAFLWMGLLFFWCWSRSSTKLFDTRSFGQGFARGSLILIPVWLATVLLNALLQTNSWVVMFSGSCPFFVAMLCAVWNLSRNTRSPGPILK